MSRKKQLWICTKAWFFLFIIFIQLRVIGLNRILLGLKKNDKDFESTKLDILYMIKISRLVYRAAAYFPWRADCLPRSIAIFKLLTLSGFTVDLYIGVKRPNFEAHAWIQHKDRVITDAFQYIRQYQPIWSTGQSFNNINSSLRWR